MKKLIAAGIIGTFLLFSGNTHSAKAAVNRRPYRPVVRPYAAYRPGYRTTYAPYAYGYGYPYGYGYGYNPYYYNGVYVGIPGLNLRIGR